MSTFTGLALIVALLTEQTPAKAQAPRRDGGVEAPTWTWRRLDARGPSRRAGHVQAFDAARKKTVLFGGFGPDGNFLGDTWAFDGQAWAKLDVAGPPARTEAALVFDPDQKRLVLFGGRNDTGSLGDTWTFDGQRWRQFESDRCLTRAPGT